VYGISFVFAMLSVGIACVLLRYSRKRLIPLLALAALWLLPAIPQGMRTSEDALVVQPNIDPDLDWTSGMRERAEQQLTALSNALPAPMVIWPELPAPLYFYNDPVFHQIAVEVARRHGYFLFGTVAFTGAKQPLNSAVLLGPEGQEAGRYDKIELVPFGEYVPPVFGFVNRVTQEAGDFVPGSEIKVLPAGSNRLGVFICYESAFPNLVRQFTKQGANVLVNLSNDAYFGRSEAREQHLLIARMRAIENRRFLIRATNDGFSAVIDPAGRIVQALPAYQQLVARVRYAPIEETTFYARHGDWFAWGCLAVALILACSPLKNRARK
jgi:apolipoprotein N-acyltransferase